MIMVSMLRNKTVRIRPGRWVPWILSGVVWVWWSESHIYPPIWINWRWRSSRAINTEHRLHHSLIIIFIAAINGVETTGGSAINYIMMIAGV
jgi:hypothetical protein